MPAGGEPDAPIHSFYLASLSAARWLPGASNVRFSLGAMAGVGRLPALKRVDRTAAALRTAVIRA